MVNVIVQLFGKGEDMLAFYNWLLFLTIQLYLTLLTSSKSLSSSEVGVGQNNLYKETYFYLLIVYDFALFSAKDQILCQLLFITCSSINTFFLSV